MSSKRWKFLLPEVLIGAMRKIGMVCLMWFSLGEPSWAIDPDPNPDPNDCVNDVVGSIQGSPADLLFGQSATLNWSASRPSNCPTVLKLGPDQFNETLISSSGSRVVTPGNQGTHVWYVRAERRDRLSALHEETAVDGLQITIGLREESVSASLLRDPTLLRDRRELPCGSRSSNFFSKLMSLCVIAAGAAHPFGVLLTSPFSPRASA